MEQEITIDNVIELITPNSEQDSSSSASIGRGASENEFLITELLEMWASRLGVVVCGWAAAVLVQGGMVFMIETKDRVFVTIMFFFVCFRYWHYFCPQATGSLTEANRSLSANNIQRQSAVSIRFINGLIYWCKLTSAITSVVLSILRLASHDFGQAEIANKAARDFVLQVFYVVALAEALMLLFALTFDTIMATSLPWPPSSSLLTNMGMMILLQVRRTDGVQMNGDQMFSELLDEVQMNECLMNSAQLRKSRKSEAQKQEKETLQVRRTDGVQMNGGLMNLGRLDELQMNESLMNSAQLRKRRKPVAQSNAPMPQFRPQKELISYPSGRMTLPTTQCGGDIKKHYLISCFCSQFYSHGPSTILVFKELFSGAAKARKKTAAK